MRNLLFIVTVMVLLSCEKTGNKPQNFDEYLKEKTIFKITTDPLGSKVFFLSGIVDQNVPPYVCSIHYIYQLSCTDGAYFVAFENLDYIADFTVDNNCSLYACNGPNLIKLSPPHDSITVKKISNVFSSVSAGSNGDIWAGTWGDGLYHYNGNSWIHYNSENSDLPADNISEVICSTSGITWATVADDSVSIIRITDESWKIFGYKNHGGDNPLYINAFTVNKEGLAYVTLWIDNRTCLMTINDLGFNQVDLPAAMADLTISRLESGLQGEIYAIIRKQDQSEIYLLDGEEWFKVVLDKQIIHFNEIAVDADNNIWIGTQNGVEKFSRQLTPLKQDDDS